MNRRQGPLIKIKAICIGCQYERAEPYHVQGDSGCDVTCTHPNNPGKYIGDSTWNTPAWCPLLATAIDIFKKSKST